MKTKNIEAKYVKSINGTDDILYDTKPQIAFMGRSNVGKSSLINSLLSQKLARSSSKPGKTVFLDFFLINNSLYFVDLPGYGFAHASKERQEHYRKLIAWYLFSSGVTPKLVVLIVDAKVGVTDYDKESVDLLTQYKISFLVVANKVDKLKMGQRHKKLSEIQKSSSGAQVIPHSIVTGEGRGELAKAIFKK